MRGAYLENLILTSLMPVELNSPGESGSASHMHIALGTRQQTTQVQGVQHWAPRRAANMLSTQIPKMSL